METLPTLNDFDGDILTPVVKEKILDIPVELNKKSEKQLRGRLKPSTEEMQFKQQFHEEFNIAKERNKKMVMTRVYGGVYKRDYFYERVLNNHLLMAWVTTPLADLDLKISAALLLGADRFEELINMDITTSKRIKDENNEWTTIKEVDPKKAMVLVSVMKYLADRHLGLAVQKQVTVNINEPSLKDGDKAELNMDKVNERLRELEEKLGETNISVLPAED
jgi:hypothetical protein